MTPVPQIDLEPGAEYTFDLSMKSLTLPETAMGQHKPPGCP